ncbi:MAG: hypothetical protein ABI696_12485 [Rubrivivax sp.]
MYTYNVTCSFTVQYTFTENEVEQAVEGGEGDLDPTSVALAEMAAEVRDCLADRFGIVEVEAWADFDELLGDEEDDDAPG